MYILSIDSACGGDFIKNQAKISKQAVKDLINELKRTLSSDSFNVNTYFILIRKDKAGDDHYYSTTYTLIDLEYDAQDVVDTLKTLTVADYSETLYDNDDSDPIWLHVFGKNINGRMVYIKLKIRETDRKCVVCVSFHYAKNNILFPYL